MLNILIVFAAQQFILIIISNVFFREEKKCGFSSAKTFLKTLNGCCRCNIFAKVLLLFVLSHLWNDTIDRVKCFAHCRKVPFKNWIWEKVNWNNPSVSFRLKNIVKPCCFRILKICEIWQPKHWHIKTEKID